MAALRTSLIGAGAIAQAYAKALQDNPDVEVVGVADVRAEAADAVAALLGCSSYSSHVELADEAGSEAAIVCTPPATHPRICIDLLRRGVHVLCEKPLAINARDARQMLEVAQESGALLTMASKFRFVDDVIEAKSIVASGALGDVLLFENTFASRVDMLKRWNADPTVAGGGVLIDNGTHSVDIMRYLFGRLAELQVVEGKRHQGLQVEDTVRMTVRTTAGVIGNIDLSWSIDKELPYYISIYGSGGTLLVGWKESKYRRRSDVEWTPIGSGYDKAVAFRNQVANFVASVRGTEQPRVSPEEALSSVEVVEAGYAALRASGWQPVDGSRVGLSPRARSQGDLARVHPTAIVEDGVQLGESTAVWDNVHIRSGTRIGDECIIGGKTIIAYDVTIGSRVKLNSFVYVCHGVTIEDGVMVSAGTVFTNDHLPRAASPELDRLLPSAPDGTTRHTRVREGATIGANCTIGSELEIGRFAMVGMGSLVTRSVPDFHLAVGSPARTVGCVCRCGEPLGRFDDGSPPEGPVTCGACGRDYVVEGTAVREVGTGAASGAARGEGVA